MYIRYKQMYTYVHLDINFWLLTKAKIKAKTYYLYHVSVIVHAFHAAGTFP